MDDSKVLIALVGLAYLYIACRQYFKADINVAGMFLGYAIAQYFIWNQAK
jgi:hypothetical protein